MFFNTIPFVCVCVCGKISCKSSKFQNDWKNEKCYSCKSNLIVYKNEKIVFNFNENKFFATCNCNKVKFLSEKIDEKWYSQNCDLCNTKIRVYNDKHIEIKQDKKTKKIFICSCECERTMYYSNVINFNWEQERCKDCQTKLILKNNNDNSKKIICNFNFESFHLRPTRLFTSVCFCGSLHYQCNYIRKEWKNIHCKLCSTSLSVYHSIHKIKLIDFNLKISKELDNLIERLDSVEFSSLEEVEAQYGLLYNYF